MNDSELIARLLAGDREVDKDIRAWVQAAFAPYRARLAADLEDLEQEVLLALTLALREGRFRRQSTLKTYVRTYAHHKCIDQLRALSRRQWLDIEELDLPDDNSSPLDELSRTESTDITLRVLEEMPESCRELWQMLQQGLRYREMSRRLGVAEGALRARVLRCRKRALEMRNRLSSEHPRNKTPASTTK